MKIDDTSKTHTKMYMTANFTGLSQASQWNIFWRKKTKQFKDEKNILRIKALILSGACLKTVATNIWNLVDYIIQFIYYTYAPPNIFLPRCSIDQRGKWDVFKLLEIHIERLGFWFAMLSIYIVCTYLVVYYLFCLCHN